MPTELDTMKHAKEYIDKLANGIDPFTDKPVPDDDIVNNVKLSRCFFYISGILEKVIENGGEVSPVYSGTIADGNCIITDEVRSELVAIDDNITPKAVNDMINVALIKHNCRQIKSGIISKWLTELDLIQRYDDIDGKRRRRVTSVGEEEGLIEERRFTAKGFPYNCILLSKKAQQFVIDNIDAIVSDNSTKSEKKPRKPFVVTDEIRNNLVPTSEAVSVSVMTATINKSVCEGEGMLKVGMIAQWLEKQGILENTELPGGRKRRLPTDEGLQLGIFTEQRTSMSGDEYTAVLYPPAAQEYIYSHIDEIAGYNNK